LANIAEGIVALGRSERSRLRSLIETAVKNLIKQQASLATEPRAGWGDAIDRAPGDIGRLLHEGPR
jgi:hypothetical protein